MDLNDFFHRRYAESALLVLHPSQIEQLITAAVQPYRVLLSEAFDLLVVAGVELEMMDKIEQLLRERK